MDAVAEIGGNPVSKQLGMEMSRLPRDGIAEPNPSRETKFSGANADKEI